MPQRATGQRRRRRSASPTTAWLRCATTCATKSLKEQLVESPLSYGRDLAAALEYRKKIDTVAAQQMLLCHYKNTNTQAGRSPGYASFETQMHGYGYPANCKKVAITNGSKIGLKHAFAPGELIVALQSGGRRRRSRH